MPNYVATSRFKADGEVYAVGRSVPVDEIQNGYILKETGLIVLEDSDEGQVAAAAFAEASSAHEKEPEGGEPEPSMSELFGDDLAGDLQRGGFTSVEEVRGASEEELEAVKGIGKKSVKRIRAVLGEGGATG